MNNIFGGIFGCVKIQKGYFVFLLLGTMFAIVLGVISAINFGDGFFTINLDHIAYIRFLKDECGFMSMFFGLFLSLSIFFFVILICHYKSFLIPIGVLFYLYLVYSQVVIFMSIILIYGILNCVILAVLMLLYCLAIWAIFILLKTQALCFLNTAQYLRSCFNFKNSAVLFCGISLIILKFIFSLILLILKKYVNILIF